MVQIGDLRPGVGPSMRESRDISSGGYDVPSGETVLWPARLNRLLTRIDDLEVNTSGVKAIYNAQVKEEMSPQEKAELILKLLAEKGVPEYKQDQAA